ncbi:nodulation-signaling pathway 2 protein-like [Carica papaya]|uniref:nodulation-signaling pathway 2 protein-like n=1 Tax=Carica papaya TaxID=3649 RepID=UPI000B8C9D80|nr:nodulation-signaling pathway 2 protein-like [Carica papaya]
MVEATANPFDQLSIIFPSSDSTDSLLNYVVDEYNMNHSHKIFSPIDISLLVPHSPAAVLSDEFIDYPSGHLLHQSVDYDLEEMEPFKSTQMENITRWLDEEDDEEESLISFVNHHRQDLFYLDQDVSECKFDELMHSDEASMEFDEQFLILPTKEMEIDKQLSVKHLEGAFAEAMEKEQGELAEVIRRRINEKLSPVGDIEERVMYYWFQGVEEKQIDYIKQESNKIFGAALETFYQIFPYGMFAHLAANSAIVESMPCGAEVLHIIDFDVGQGVQWCSLMATLAHQHQQKLKMITLRITSIKWEDEEKWRFVETKRRLCDYAMEIGVKLIVEDQVELQEMVINRLKNRGYCKREWLGFNCMWGIPHMGRRRRRRDVREFISGAKEILGWGISLGGIISFGDGESSVNSQNQLMGNNGFGSFYNRYRDHYKALLESMEWSFFPNHLHLSEARVAMESLFAAPFLSPHSWIKLWEEMKQDQKQGAGFSFNNFEASFGLQGRRVREESLIEAKEMVGDDHQGKTPYKVRIQGLNAHQMVLESKGTPLITVSTWQ